MSETERNRAVVDRFVDLFYRRKDVRLAFETFVTAGYIQHNPGIADGRDAAIRALEPMFSKSSFLPEVRRVLVDGDFAVVHLFVRSDTAVNGAAVMDMFRLQDGMIVEHWDVLQLIPTTSANPHPMF